MSRFEAGYGGHRHRRGIHNVERGIHLANLVTSMPEFYTAVGNHSGFDPLYLEPKGLSPSKIAEILEDSDAQVRVLLGRARRRVLGWTYPSRPDQVWLNRRRLNRSAISIGSTLVHEWVHAVDALVDEDFHHGSNSSKGKDNTVPYWIGSLAGDLMAKMVGSVSASVSTKSFDPGVDYRTQAWAADAEGSFDREDGIFLEGILSDTVLFSELDEEDASHAHHDASHEEV